MSGMILCFSVVLWFLSYFPNHNGYDSVAQQQENSYIGLVGKTIEPILEPLGFDWKMGVGIVAGVGAKELVVSTLGVMYAPEEVQADECQAAAGSDQQEQTADAAPATKGHTRLQKALLHSVPPAGALAYMVFILLYFPCVATFVAIRKESGSWKWAIITAVYTIVLAWIAAFITFQIASLFI